MTAKGNTGPRVLFVATYSRYGESTGGVVRFDALVSALDRRGYRTQTLAVLPPRSRRGSHSGETVLALADASFSPEDRDATGLYEVLVGVRGSEDAAVMTAAKALATNWQPDVYVLEQPFLLPIVEAMLAELVREYHVDAYPAAAAQALRADLRRQLVALVAR